MQVFVRNCLGALVLVALLGAVPASAQSPAPVAAEVAQAEEAPIAVPADAPPGSSQEVAIGSGIGALIGIVIVAAMISSL